MSRRDAAIHEAGHAAYLAFVGVPFNYATIDGPPPNCAFVALWKPPSIWDAAQRREFIVTAYMGGLASYHDAAGRLPQRPLLISGTDRQLAEQLSLGPRTPDVERYTLAESRRHASRAESFREDCRREAERWLSDPDHFAGVRAVADVLQWRGRLDESQIARICREFFPVKTYLHD